MSTAGLLNRYVWFVTTIYNRGPISLAEVQLRYESHFGRGEELGETVGYMAYLYFGWRVVIESSFFIMPYRALAHASVVCYALGITEVDPIRLGLDFNRFIPTDKPSFAEIGITTNTTASQIQTEIMNLDFDEDRERLGEREMIANCNIIVSHFR